MNILIVEDRERVAKAIAQAFSKVDQVRDLHMVQSYDDALCAMSKRHYDVFLLDIHLQKSRNGIDLCRTIRRHNQESIIVVVSGFIDENVVKQIYDAGANDLVRKPFARCEVRLKVIHWWMFIKAGQSKKNALEYRGLKYDFQRSELSADGKIIPLTKAFRRLVLLFLESPETLVPYTKIQREIWGDHDTSFKKRNIKERVFEFKKRLPERYKDWLRSVPGEGYKLSEE